MCGDCVSDCVFGFDIDLFSSLTPCFAVTLADCIFEQLVSRQELLVYQLRPSIAGSSGSSTKELANEAMAALKNVAWSDTTTEAGVGVRVAVAASRNRASASGHA